MSDASFCGFPTVSGVKCVREVNTHDVNIHAVLAGIKEGRWKDAVLAVRDAYAKGDKTAAAPLKNQLPGVLFSGRFSERNDGMIDSHSGILCVDIDSLNGDLSAVREKLGHDKHVLAVFTSPTGRGLKALVPIAADASKHTESFEDAQHYFENAYGLTIDPQCRNLSRICYVSFDPDMISKPNAEIIPPDRRLFTTS